MTFDQWIDAVDAQVRRRLGSQVRTEELSWDSAMWVGRGGTVTAAMDNDEATATFSFDAGDRLSVPLEARPDGIASTIADRLA